MDEGLFDKLKNISGKFPDRFSILEEQIDVKLQLEYFKVSKKIKTDAKKLQLPIGFDQIPDITNKELTEEDLKNSLVKLASIDDPKAYRMIEDFCKNENHSQHQWALLAMQESKMLLESSLLDENQIFISTGLGGKGNMLRYFIVLVGDNLIEFQEFHQKMIHSEMDFALKNSSSELEDVSFSENYALLTVLIPFNVEIHRIFKNALDEMNQYGSFLKDNFLITNVKKLSLPEIKDIVENNKLPTAESISGLDIEELGDNDQNNEE